MQRRRFYCENCGEEVKPTAKVCPRCGAFFTNVRCPRCNYTGKAHEFTRGCPVCGYLGAIHSPPKNAATTRQFQVASKGPDRYGKKHDRPWWLFPMIMIALILSFIILSVIYMRL
ncbi:MAG: zinc ribbon domain-containing protein [Spirochaetaceae bacterium]